MPIHRHLALLVSGMGAAGATGRVFPVDRVRDVEARVAELRGHLRAAGIVRPELHFGTSTLRPFEVRSCRTTFATLCARSGFDSAWIDAWLGHAPKTTSAKHYVKGTGALAAGIFPALPPDLSFGRVSAFRSNAVNDSASLQCEGRDLNPYRSYPAGT